MANLFFGNDADLILDGMRLAADNSVLNDADLVAHFFNAASSQAITGATNSTPIEVTVADHGLTTGDAVVIAHVLGNKAANGYWLVTVLDANTFELDDSVGNGSYNRGGHLYDAIANAVELNLAYQSGSNGRYIAVIPSTIDMLPTESGRVIVFCSNYEFQMERDHSMLIRT